MKGRKSFPENKSGYRTIMCYVNTILAIVFCVLLAGVTVQAEQIGANAPGRDVDPVKNRAAANQKPHSNPSPSLINTAPNLLQIPLRAPLVLGQLQQTPNLCDTIPKIVNAISQKKSEANSAYVAVGSCALSSPNSKIGYYRNQIQMRCCSAAKSFSVQEQQVAGCLGSDTVQVCMDKLTRQCIRDFGQTIQMREDIQKAKDATKTLSEKTGQLSQELQNLLTIMP